MAGFRNAPTQNKPMRPFNAFLCATTTLIMVACASTVTVRPVAQVAGSSAGAGGILYSLPRTVIIADCTFTQTKRKAPKPHFAKAAKQLFGLETFDNSMDVSLGEIKLSTKTESDPERTFRARISQSPFSTQKNSFTFNKLGVLSKAESSAHNRTIEYMVTTIESAAKIAASAAKAFAQQEAVRVVGLTADEQNEVDFVLKRLEALEAQKQLLIAGNNPNAATLLDQIEAKMAKEMANFIGSKAEEKKVVSIEYTPLSTKPVHGCVSLFDFATVKKTTEDSAPIRMFTSPAMFYPKLMTPLPDWLKHTNGSVSGGSGGKIAQMKLRLHWDPVPAATARAAAAGTGKKGFHYCIPVNARVDIVDGGKMYGQGLAVQLPQYGIVAALPASTGSEKTGIKVTLDPDTGALAEVGIDAEAFDPKYIQRVGDAVNTVVAADVERKNREVTGNDELSQLQRKKNILQLQADIAKLEEAQQPQE